MSDRPVLCVVGRITPYVRTSRHATTRSVEGLSLSHFVSSLLKLLFMAALWNRAGHYIFALFLLSSSFFPRLISAVADWMSTILPRMMWPN